jgi:hypothetical protein
VIDPLVVAGCAGVAPAIAAGLLCASAIRGRGAGPAAGIGLIAAYAVLADWRTLLRPGGAEWLCWGVVAAAALACWQRRRAVPHRRSELALLLAAAVAWLVLRRVGKDWTGVEAGVRFGVPMLGAAMLVHGERALLARPSPWLLPVLAVACLCVDAALLTLNGSVLLGQLCGAVAAALGAALGTALWRRPFHLDSADGTWIGVAHAGFLLAGVHLASLPPLQALLAGVAPVAPLLAARLAVAPAVMLTLAPALAALIWAVASLPDSGF